MLKTKSDLLEVEAGGRMIFLLASGVSLFFGRMTAALVGPAIVTGVLAAPAIAAAVDSVNANKFAFITMFMNF